MSSERNQAQEYVIMIQLYEVLIKHTCLLTKQFPKHVKLYHTSKLCTCHLTPSPYDTQSSFKVYYEYHFLCGVKNQIAMKTSG